MLNKTERNLLSPREYIEKLCKGNVTVLETILEESLGLDLSIPW